MLKNIIYSLITKGTVALINFLILILSSKYLGVSSRGEISIFVLNITVIQVINEVYTGYSLVHFVPKFSFRKILGFGLFYTLVFCSLSNAIVVFFNKQVAGYEWLGYCLSLIIIVNTFNCVLILGKEKISTYNLLSFIQPCLLLVGLVFCIFVLKQYTFAAYVYPLLLSFIVALIISGTAVSRSFLAEKPDKRFELRPVLVNGLMFQSCLLMYIFGNRYSFYVLPDTASVGLYASASSLMESVLILTNGITPVLLARIANQGNTPASMEMTLSLGKAGLFFSSLVALLIFLLPDDFFVRMMGSGFAGIRHLMLLYAPGVLCAGVSGVMSNYFTATGKQRLVLYCYGLGFISTLALAPVLIRKYGISGAAYNADITYLIVAIAICSCFVISSGLPLKRFFTIGQDYKNLKALISS